MEHNSVGYGAGWYLDQLTIQESQKSDSHYVFSCQQWLDSGVGDGKLRRKLQLLGKVRKEKLPGTSHSEMQNHQNNVQASILMYFNFVFPA